jgi:hypothetical protein
MEYWSIGAVVLSSAAASDDMPRRQVKPRFSRAFSANRFFNAFLRLAISSGSCRT